LLPLLPPSAAAPACTAAQGASASRIRVKMVVLLGCAAPGTRQSNVLIRDQLTVQTNVQKMGKQVTPV